MAYMYFMFSPVYRLKKIGGKWIKVRVNPYELDD